MAKWDRAQREPKQSFELFKIFRDNPEMRDLNALAKIAETPLKNVEKYCEKWQWSVRANAFDAFVLERAKSAGADDDCEISGKRSRQTLESLELIEDLLDLVRDKIRADAGKIEEGDVEKALKLASAVSKALPDLLKAARELAAANDSRRPGGFDIADLIRGDAQAFEISQKLLARLSEIT